MQSFACNNCGSAIPVIADQTEYICANCGAEQSLPEAFEDMISRAEEPDAQTAARKNMTCVATAYAQAQGTKVVKEASNPDDTCCWYLRSAGFDHGMVAYVQYAGAIRTFGTIVDSYTNSVRPAMYLKTEG